MGPGLFSQLSSVDLELHESLWLTYSAQTANPSEGNLFEQRRLLFYSIPVITTEIQSSGYKGSDRESIDKLVEKYGVTSATALEILERTKQFVLALATAL